MISLHKSNTSDEIMEEILSGLENWCYQFNSFSLIYFKYLKYIFALILICIGILIFFRARGVYFKNKANNFEKKEDPLKKTRIILASIYIIFAIGILFNYLTYFLIWVLEPLPDRFIFNFINFNGNIDPYYLNRIEDVNAARFEHEKTIYYCIALGSFSALIHFILSVWYFLENTRPITNPEKTLGNLTASLFELIFFGWTTSLPFLL